MSKAKARAPNTRLTAFVDPAILSAYVTYHVISRRFPCVYFAIIQESIPMVRKGRVHDALRSRQKPPSPSMIEAGDSLWLIRY